MWVGAFIMGVDVTHVVAEIDWTRMSMMTMATELETLLIPFVVGTFVSGAIAGFLGYLMVLVYIYRDRLARSESQAQGSQESSQEEDA